MGVQTLSDEQMAEMERYLGRPLTPEERRILSLTVHTSPIKFSRCSDAARSKQAAAD